MNDSMRFNEEEVGLAKAKFDREIAAFNVIDEFFPNTTENPHKITLLGLDIPLFPPSDVTLLAAMELRMDAQLLNIKGISEGKITSKSIPTHPGESRTGITASKIADTKVKYGIPASAPIPNPIVVAPPDLISDDPAIDMAALRAAAASTVAANAPKPSRTSDFSLPD
jgi:hypothetical protein